MAKAGVREAVRLFEKINANTETLIIDQRDYKNAAKAAVEELVMLPGEQRVIRVLGKTYLLHNASQGLLVTEVLLDETV